MIVPPISPSDPPSVEASRMAGVIEQVKEEAHVVALLSEVECFVLQLVVRQIFVVHASRLPVRRIGLAATDSATVE